jgi:hypothetical protein
MTVYIFLEYVDSVFRGTRQLRLSEGRTISAILRKEYPKLFIPSVNDRLPFHIRDGIRFIAEKRHKTKIQEGIENIKKRTPTGEDAGPRKKAKKTKVVYLVNPKKYASVATEEEMAQDFSEEDLGTEDTYRIHQCKIR